MTMKDEWQEQRQQRQQEVAHRQQKVLATLALTRQERQNRASQLRSDLSLFMDGLDRENETRLARSRQFQQELQQFYLGLQQQTQGFLASASEQRQAQAQQMAEDLDRYIQSLQDQTARFLAAKASDRAAMAKQLAADLFNFQVNLKKTVESLRQEIRELHQQIQMDVQALKADTQRSLRAMQQKRLQDQVKLVKALMFFAENLRSEVQSYCAELDLMRQQRAHNLHQQLRQTRRNRQVEMQALFNRFREFRAELRAFHADLQKTVGIQMPVPQPAQPAYSAKPSLTVSEGTNGSTFTPPVVQLASPAVMPASSMKVPVVPSEISMLAQPSEQADQVPPLQYEKDVYNHLHKVAGARLVEIESALGINRFQAVDALRSLIKKGLITQRDRVYLVQESLTPV